MGGPREPRTAEPAARQAGADPRGRRRGPVDRLRPDAARGAASRSPTGTTTAPTELAEEVGCRTVTWSMRASTLADVIINCTPVGMHPERRRHAASARGVQPAGDGRLRHGLSSREHDVAQAGARARLHDGHRRRHVRPPGGPPVQALHRAGRPARPDARRPQAQARAAPANDDDPLRQPRSGRAWRSSATAGPASRPSAGSWPTGWAGRSSTPIVELEARAAGRSASIFAESGEPAFRDWEERTLARADAEPTRRRSWPPAAGPSSARRTAAAPRRSASSSGSTADPDELAAPAARPTAAALADRPALTPAGTLAEIAAGPRRPDAALPRGGRRRRSTPTAGPPDEVADAILDCWTA